MTSSHALARESLSQQDQPRLSALRAALREAVAADVDSHTEAARVSLGMVELRLGNFAQALAAVRDVEVTEPDVPANENRVYNLVSVHFVRACARANLGEFEAANAARSALANLVASRFADDWDAQALLREVDAVFAQRHW